jgi:hypothetical protein
VCVTLEAAVQQAIKSHNPVALLEAKQERVNHLALQRSDRISYYHQREIARSPERCDASNPVPQ